MSLWKLLFGTKLGPREMTVGEIIGRKALKAEIKDIVSEEDDKKKAEYNPILGKLALCGLLAKMSELDKEAPFKSEAQRRKFYAMKSRGEISGAEVAKWEAETPDKKLPERVEKKGGLLSWAGMGASMLGKSRLTRGLGLGAMVADAGVEAVKAKAPQMNAPRMASEVDRLVALTKQAIEFHNYPPSDDATGPSDVKKKSLSKDSALLSAVSPGATSKGISALTKGPSSQTKGWLGRGVSGSTSLTMGEGKMAPGVSSDERVVGAAGGSHIQRGV